MLIVLAGMIGAGKSTVARQLSERLAIPVHSIDQDKIEVGQTEAQFQYWVSNGIPFPDEFRRRVFDRALSQLRELAQQHQHVIVEETFHKKAIREPFFEQAGQILALQEFAPKVTLYLSFREKRGISGLQTRDSSFLSE